MMDKRKLVEHSNKVFRGANDLGYYYRMMKTGKAPLCISMISLFRSLRELNSFIASNSGTMPVVAVTAKIKEKPNENK